MGALLCFLGFHKWHWEYKYLPSIWAKIVTDLITHCQCVRCPKIKYHEHLVWNGSEMVKVQDYVVEKHIADSFDRIRRKVKDNEN